MNQVFVLLGSNLGPRQVIIKKAADALLERVGSGGQVSSLYESAPWQMDSNHPFINQVLWLQSSVTLTEFWAACRQIEKQYPRKIQKDRYLDRYLDIDLLFWNDEVVQSEQLNIPHPRLAERRFALLPLCELAPHWVHPQLQMTVQNVLDQCQDSSRVRKL